MNRRASVFLSLAIFCLAMSGCTKKIETDQTVVHCYESWVGFAGVAVGIGASIFGWFIKSSAGFRGWLFFIMAMAGTVMFSPFGFFDHVTVSPDRLQVQWGFWTFPTKHDIPFDNVNSVALTESSSVSRRGRRTNYRLEFQLKDGKKESLTATNTLMEAAADDLTQQLAARGIMINDLTGE